MHNSVVFIAANCIFNTANGLYPSNVFLHRSQVRIIAVIHVVGDKESLSKAHVDLNGNRVPTTVLLLPVDPYHISNWAKPRQQMAKYAIGLSLLFGLCLCPSPVTRVRSNCQTPPACDTNRPEDKCFSAENHSQMYSFGVYAYTEEHVFLIVQEKADLTDRDPKRP